MWDVIFPPVHVALGAEVGEPRRFPSFRWSPAVSKICRWMERVKKSTDIYSVSRRTLCIALPPPTFPIPKAAGRVPTAVSLTAPSLTRHTPSLRARQRPLHQAARCAESRFFFHHAARYFLRGLGPFSGRDWVACSQLCACSCSARGRKATPRFVGLSPAASSSHGIVRVLKKQVPM